MIYVDSISVYAACRSRVFRLSSKNGQSRFQDCPLFYHSKIQRLCRCRASHSLILSLSHQVKTNTRFARACFPADVPNYAIFSCLHNSCLLIQFCACRDMIIHHQQVQLLLAVLLAHCGKQHTAGVNAHHGTRRQVGDGDQRLTHQLFRLVISMDTGKDGAICAGSIVQGEL